MLLDSAQALLERLQVRDDQSNVARDYLRSAGWQVKLGPANVRPHVQRTDVHVRVTGKAQPDDVEPRCKNLVGDGDVDMLELDDVAEVIRCRGTIPAHHLCRHLLSPWTFNCRSRGPN